MSASQEAAATRRRVVFYRVLAEESEPGHEREKWLALRRQSARELKELEEEAGEATGADEESDGAAIPQPLGRLVKTATQVPVGATVVLVIGGMELKGMLWDRVRKTFTVVLTDGRHVQVELGEGSPYLVFEGTAAV